MGKAGHYQAAADFLDSEAARCREAACQCCRMRLELAIHYQERAAVFSEIADSLRKGDTEHG